MLSLARTLCAAAVAAQLSACTAPPLAGTYRADFTSSSLPDVALAGELQELTIEFQGDAAIIAMSAFGDTRRVRVEAHYEDGTVVLEEPRQWVLAIRDEVTLECLQCPEGLPDIWRRVPAP